MVINKQLSFALVQAKVIAAREDEGQRNAALARVPEEYKELITKTVAAIRSPREKVS